MLCLLPTIDSQLSPPLSIFGCLLSSPAAPHCYPDLLLFVGCPLDNPSSSTALPRQPAATTSPRPIPTQQHQISKQWSSCINYSAHKIHMARYTTSTTTSCILDGVEFFPPDKNDGDINVMREFELSLYFLF